MNSSDQAKSIAARLSKLSRSLGISYQSIATSFLLERLLARLVAHQDLEKEFSTRLTCQSWQLVREIMDEY